MWRNDDIDMLLKMLHVWYQRKYVCVFPLSVIFKVKSVTPPPLTDNLVYKILLTVRKDKCWQCLHINNYNLKKNKINTLKNIDTKYKRNSWIIIISWPISFYSDSKIPLYWFCTLVGHHENNKWIKLVKITFPFLKIKKIY